MEVLDFYKPEPCWGHAQAAVRSDGQRWRPELRVRRKGTVRAIVARTVKKKALELRWLEFTRKEQALLPATILKVKAGRSYDLQRFE